MTLTSLYRNPTTGKYYDFQKSKVFLYPMLDIKRGACATPIDTYIAWQDNLLAEDGWLICLYPLRDDPEFVKFEKTVLLGNKLFEDFRIGEDGNGIYIFNFKEYSKDWNHFLNGKYSKFSPVLKNKIKAWFRESSNFVYVESFIDPEKYYPIYAELLNIKVEILKESKELCPLPDMKKETLIMISKEVPDKINL